MLRIRGLVFYLYFSFSCFAVFSQTFPCEGNLILGAKTSNTTAYKIGFGPFGIVIYDPMAVYLNEEIDALGFNPKDNYIYGVHKNTNSIVRLFRDGSFEIISGSTPINSYAGDCSPEGLYLCHDNELDQILVFNVLDNFFLVNSLDLFWDPNSENSGPFNTQINDFAIDPNNPNVAYAFQGNYLQDDFEPAVTRGYLLKINLDFSDPNVGMVTPIASIPPTIILQLGSLFFTKEGQLYGFGPYTSGRFIENRLISINPITAEAIVQGTSAPIANMSDGCSCPYSLSFQNNVVPRDITCSNSELSYILTINNRSNEELFNLTITDTIPEGMIIREVSGNFDGNVATGAGTRILTINDLHILPKDNIVINIIADIIDIPIGLLPNQAHLTNLPLLFGEVKHSDDPATPDFVGDASRFFSNPRPIDNVELEITHPSNCLNPNDAQILVSSPILIAGLNYQIKLINHQNWDEFFFNVLVNDNNEFIIDSLGPGDYQLAKVTPENSNCSFAWKDTMILIEPPNEQLQAMVESNSPICEGFSLQLDGVISPGGTVLWTGPERFVSSELQPRIESAANEQSGTYEMLATYGFCKQTRSIDVFVAEDIQTSINGKLEYCKREIVQLEAKGKGNNLTYSWSGPNNFDSNDSLVRIESMSANDEGVYQVIIDNGYCSDTSFSTVSMLPSPTISLSEKIETDFCEAVKLKPEISGDNNVVYSWSSNEGLTCSDCPSPELLAPFLPNYRLTVINESLCTDTAEVKISLLKEKLIYVPNTFSPNFDGFNDYFQMFPGCGVSSIKKIEIVNRWGSIVYSKNAIDHHNPQEFWDGLIGGQMGASGVYVWHAEIELVDGTNLRLFGDISLLR